MVCATNAMSKIARDCALHAAPQAGTSSRVKQGAIEQSNVHSVIEMARMIEVTRTYTQITAMMQQFSDLRRSAVEKLAEVPA